MFSSSRWKSDIPDVPPVSVARRCRPRGTGSWQDGSLAACVQLVIQIIWLKNTDKVP